MKKVIVVVLVLSSIFLGIMFYKDSQRVFSTDSTTFTDLQTTNTIHDLTSLYKLGITLNTPKQKPIVDRDTAISIAKNYWKGGTNSIVSEYWDVGRNNEIVPAWIISFRGLPIPKHHPNMSVCKTCHPNQSFEPKPITEVNILVNAVNGDFIDNIKYR